MLANARVFGHVFDPLTVFWCFASDGALRCVVAEVHNTFGERHAYLLTPRPGRARRMSTSSSTCRRSTTCRVTTRCGSRSPTSTSEVTIALRRNGQHRVRRQLHRHDPRRQPRRRSLGSRSGGRLMTQRVSALIRLHALRLWWRGLPIVNRPYHCEPRRSLKMNAEHRLAGRTIWIVGASSGIGAALATELVRTRRPRGDLRPPRGRARTRSPPAG